MTMAATTRTTEATSSSSLASSLLRRPFEGGEEEEENDELNRSVGLAHLESFSALNRSRVAEWVEHQKALVDAHAERLRQAALAEQSQLDRLHQNLLALQLDQSLCLADDDNEGAEQEEKGDESTDRAEGTTTQRRLVTEQKQVEADLDRVQAVARDRQAEIEGSSKHSSKSIDAASCAVGLVGTDNERATERAHH
jgi:hypothetical protein